MKNYIKIGDKTIELSEETVKNVLQQFDDKIEIKGDFIWYKEQYKNMDTSKIKLIGYYAYLRGCSSDLSSLKSIGSFADLRGYSGDLSSLELIGSWAYLQGCSIELKKSLAKTLKKCGNIYVEFRDNPMTLEEFREYAETL